MILKENFAAIILHEKNLIPNRKKILKMFVQISGKFEKPKKNCPGFCTLNLLL